MRERIFGQLCSRLKSMSYILYALVSLGLYAVYNIFWYFPVFYKKKKSYGAARSKAETIGHRGSRNEGLPENTIAAFRDAVGAGADIVELDVWLTADGKVVVHHDDTLSRMTCGSSEHRIVDLKHADIPPITLTKSQAKRTEAFKKKECLTIPLFVDALAAVPHPTCLIIEFKQDSDRLVSEVLRILNETGRKDDVFWFSLDEKINKKLRAADSSIPTITSIPAMLKTLALFYVGLLPFCEVQDAVYGITVDEISLEKIQHEKALASLPGWVHKILAFLFQGKPPYAMVTPALFAHLRRRGIHVWFLGVNSERDLQLAVRTGATAVLTDRIHWLKGTMQEKNIKFMKIE